MLSPYADARMDTLVATKNTKKMDFAAISDAFAGGDNKIISTFQFHHWLYLYHIGGSACVICSKMSIIRFSTNFSHTFFVKNRVNVLEMCLISQIRQS